MHTYANKKVPILAIESPYEMYALRIFLILLACLVCAYLYFVAASVLNVVARKDALAQTSQLEESVASLETRYFALSQSVTPEEGLSMGFQVLKPSYVYRPGTVGEANTAGVEI